ncbi:MAG: hypothetical protein IJK62_14910 [Bacteroidales bacterium]|nr:hypothetical protein [Bacteroidales bacterium]
MNLFSETFTSGTFTSTRHQRYESGVPVMGLQNCNRSVKIEKNINGHPGYNIPNNFGYIITIINLDTNYVQMSPKPMKIVEQSAERLLLKGYKTEVVSPFGGLIDFDLSNYGFEIINNGDQIEKCILYMYDRNVRIEYYK